MSPFRYFLALCAFCALLVAFYPGHAAAQTSTPTPTATLTPTPTQTTSPALVQNVGSCAADSDYIFTFDNDTEGWNQFDFGQAQAGWLTQKTFRVWGGNTGYGVLTVSGIGLVSKNMYLYPGNYRLTYRGGVDLGLDNGYINWTRRYMNNVYQSFATIQHTDLFEEHTLYFNVEDLGNYFLALGSLTDGRTKYIDYICIKNVTGTLTATPTRPVCDGCLATPTPYTQTPTPYPSPATPIPTNAWQCSDDATSPNATATPRVYTTTVTPTPLPIEIGMAVLETFDYGVRSEGFSVIGTGFGGGAPMEASPGPDGGQSSFAIPYKNNGSSPASSLDKAVIFENPGLAQGVYMDIWATADIVPISGTATLHVWLLDGNNNQWYEVKTQTISARNWYPVQIRPGTVVTVPSGQIAAVAVTASRSDNPAGGYMYVDNWYLYNRVEYAPPCDGTYPQESLPIGEVGGIRWPADKACPPSIIEGNNFWGPILTQFTVWMYTIFTDADEHTPGIWVAWGRTTILEPMITIFVYLGVLFDWGYVMMFLGVTIGLFSITIVAMSWKALKRIINPLN